MTFQVLYFAGTRIALPQDMDRSVPNEPILVVDDDPICCRAIAEVLERDGYRVESTTDPIAALWRTLKRKYALLVTDLAMPGLAGTRLLTEVRRANPGMPGILVSGFPDRRALADAEELAVPLLTKPFSPDDFLEAVRTQLHACVATGLTQ